MKYRIVHTTLYTYSANVSNCRNIVMLTPRDDGRIIRQYHRLTIRPTPRFMTQNEDVYGNRSHHFTIEENHRTLSITSTSRVIVRDQEPIPPGHDIPWEHVRDNVKNYSDPRWQEAAPFRFASPRVPITPEFQAYTEKAFPAGRGILQCLDALTTQIHADFAYDPVATNVNTPTAEAFRHRRGVCQDFAHVQLACLRSQGIPARYISGYLRTLPPKNGPRLIGASESHAWVAAYCGADFGWIEFDPTNNCRGHLDHIPVAWGRDYSDVVPVRGVYLGGGNHQLSVSVHVEETNENDPQPT